MKIVKPNIDEFEVMATILGYKVSLINFEIGNIFILEIRNVDNFLKFRIKIRKDYCDVSEGTFFERSKFKKRHIHNFATFSTLDEALKEVLKYL